MRNQVLAFLTDLPKTPQEQFNKGFELLRKSEGANTRTVQFINSQGFSTTRLESIVHELKKIHAIGEKELAIAKAEPKQVKEVDPTAKVIQMDVTDSKVVRSDVYSDASGKPLTNDDGTAKVPEFKTPSEVFEFAPVDVKTDIKLREEFPFLKDPNCPDKMLVLVGKKISHYENYVGFHAALMTTVGENDEQGNVIVAPKALTDDEVFAIAKGAVASFEANQDIYDELNHYKATGEILGKHPIFADEELRSKLDGQNLLQVNLRKSNLKNYLGKAEKFLSEPNDEKKLTAKREQVKVWTRELEITEEWLAKNANKK